MKNFIINFIKECLFFQNRDIELKIVGALSWIAIIGITLLITEPWK